MHALCFDILTLISPSDIVTVEQQILANHTMIHLKLRLYVPGTEESFPVSASCTASTVPESAIQTIQEIFYY